MLNIKVAYNNETKNQIDFLLGSPVVEAYNEDDYREKKKALQLKASCGARELPFVAFYHDGELIRCAYSEVKECDPEHINESIEEYVNKYAHKGWITVQKIEGKNNEKIPIGKEYSGYTDTFMEGISCRVSSPTHWFRTSNVVSIDWDNKEFKTLNSTYKFNLESANGND